MKKQILLTTISLAVASTLLAQSGNVGIGTTTPEAKLHVKASSGNNQYFRITAPNDSIRLTVTDEPSFLGSNTDLRLRASNGSNTLTLSATPVNVVYDVLRSSKPLSLQSVNRIELRSENNRFGFTSVGNDIARLYLGDFGLGLNFNTDTIQARMDIKTAATDASNAFRLRNSAYAPLLNILNNGNVGIGTDAPTVKLHVAGNVRIADGTQGAGKVLTSDANGLASWQPGIVDPSAPGMDTPYVAAAGGTDIAYNNGAGWTNLIFSDLVLSEVTDMASVYDPATGIITIVTDGFYYVHSSIRLINNPVGSTFDGTGGMFMTRLEYRGANSGTWKAITTNNQNVLKGFGIPGGLPIYDGAVNTLMYLKAGNQVKATFTTYGSASLNDNPANVILSRGQSIFRLYKL